MKPRPDTAVMNCYLEAQFMAVISTSAGVSVALVLIWGVDAVVDARFGSGIRLSMLFRKTAYERKTHIYSE